MNVYEMNLLVKNMSKIKWKCLIFKSYYELFNFWWRGLCGIEVKFLFGNYVMGGF